MRLNLINKILILILLSILCIIPSIYLSLIKYVNPFFWSPLSSVSMAMSNGYLNITYPEQPTYELILYSISMVSGLSAGELSYFPIGAFIIPVCVFSVSKNILKSYKIALLLSTYFAFDFSLYPGHYSSFSYTWTRILFFVFLLLYIIYIKTSKGLVVPLIFIIFIATYYLHPTYLCWMILFSLGLNMLIYLSNIFKLKRVDLKLTIGLALMFIVIFLGFNKIFYNQYVRNIFDIDSEVISSSSLGFIKNFLGITEKSIEKYSIFIGPPTDIIGYACFIRTLLITMLIIIIAIIWIKNNYRQLCDKIDNDILLIMALFIVGIGHTVGYTLYGHFSLRYLIKIYPLIVIYLLNKIKSSEKFRITFLLILIFLGLMQTISFFIESYNNLDSNCTEINYDLVEPGSSWLLGNIQQESVILSDFDTSQILLFDFKGKNYNLIQKFYNSTIFDKVVNNRYSYIIDYSLHLFCQYMIINYKAISRFTHAYSWVRYEPLSKYIIQINNNKNLNKVYNDNLIWIFKT